MTMSQAHIAGEGNTSAIKTSTETTPDSSANSAARRRSNKLQDKMKLRSNDYQSANWLSRLTFWWLTGFFRKGFRGTLNSDDIPNVPDEFGSAKQADNLQRHWENEQKRSVHPSFVRALSRAFAIKMTRPLVLFCLSDAVKIVQPILIGQLLTYFQPETTMSFSVAMYYASGLAVSGILVSLTNVHAHFAAQVVAMRLRAAVSYLIYRKIDIKTFNKTSSGYIVNLLATDVERFDIALQCGSYLVLAPIEAAVIFYLMYRQAGVASLFALALAIVLLSLKALVGQFAGRLRTVIAKWGDARIKLMTELITGIRLVKMHCWEDLFSAELNERRREEIKYTKRSFSLRLVNFTLYLLTGRLMIAAVVLGSWALGVPVSSASLFMVIGWMEHFNFCILLMGIISIEEFVQVLRSMRRVQSFLLLKSDHTQIQANNFHTSEIGDSVETRISANVTLSGMSSSTANSVNHLPHAVEVLNLRTNWIASSTDDIAKRSISFELLDVSLSVERGELLAIAGPVGCGKTSLLMAMLGELTHTSGSLRIGGTMSYMSQQPWIFSGTVRENITFGKQYDQELYIRVLQACALTKDINLFPNKDESLVGERGLMLSGGQKSRVALARAIYRDTSIYLLDDPLSAVDTNVGRQIFNQCVCGLLRGKTRILVTHQLQYLQAADRIVLMNKGRVVDIGTLEELQRRGVDVVQYVEQKDHSENKSKETDKISVNSDDQKQAEVEEDTMMGDSAWKVYIQYLRAGRGWIFLPLFFVFCLSGQVILSASDIYLLKWTEACTPNQNSTREEICSVGQNASSTVFFKGQLQNTSSSDANTRRTVNASYVMDGPKSNQTDCNRVTTDQLYYMVFLSCSLILFLISAQFLSRLVMTASHRLHDKMFPVILRAKMRFFDTHPIGIVLNRFSRDLGFVDFQIPQLIVYCSYIAVTVTVYLGVIILVNPWLLLATLPLALAVFVLRYYAVQTTKQLKRFEAIARSPVYSHVSGTITGLQTIRALHMADEYMRRFENSHDTHNVAWFMHISAYRWFNFRCLCLINLYLLIVCFTTVLFKQDGTAELIALSLTYIILFVESYEYMMRQICQLETHMTSVERILYYTNVDQEPPQTSGHTVPPTWPCRGEIEFRNLSLRYYNDGPMILKNVNCSIRNAEKIGIVGRTGAGKSSLISALLRLSEPSGELLIDGIDVTKIGLNMLRRNVSVIPQDPVLFSGSLRRNLDFLSEYTDLELWSALQQVQLKEVVISLPGNLYTEVSEGGCNFSVGQRQLLCLARTILRRNKILVLDEATANVDHRTDELIQAAIRENFSDCTVLTVAHRLHTVMDSDRIMVIDNGAIQAFDTPEALLTTENSGFRNLLNVEDKDAELNHEDKTTTVTPHDQMPSWNI